MLTLVVENQSHGTFADLRGKLVRRLAHDAPSYSRVGASGKPGAVQFLLKRPVPVGALAAFFYRDYGFRLDVPEVSSVISIFREEFGLSPTIDAEQKTFDTLFLDDAESFNPGDLQSMHEVANG